MIKWCNVCYGRLARCWLCKQKGKAIRDAFPAKYAEFLYLWETRQKLEKFNMHSTGILHLDTQIIIAYGDWLHKRDRDFYLLRSWHQLKQAKLNTTGEAALDSKIKTRYGDWTTNDRPTE